MASLSLSPMNPNLSSCSTSSIGRTSIPVLNKNSDVFSSVYLSNSSFSPLQLSSTSNNIPTSTISFRPKLVSFSYSPMFMSLSPKNDTISSSDIEQPTPTILVAGATGGVGQLCVSGLLERRLNVIALTRDCGTAEKLFGDKYGDSLKFVTADARHPESLASLKLQEISHAIVCTGTTAFPSKRWDGNNGPEQTDLIGTRNLLAALPPSINRLVYVSSVGVTRYDQLPYNILNLFGVLKYKRMAEELVAASNIPFTIIRPGRLTDGPYTSYDLNTLLKATSGLRRDVVIKRGDCLNGEASRLVVAQACIQSLFCDITIGHAFCLSSIEGDGPGSDAKAWETLFQNA